MSTDSPVYLFALLDIDSMEDFFTDYVGPLGPINERHGAELIVGTPAVDVLEGDYTCNLTVILKFPSAEHQAAWYADPDYQPLLARRLELTNTETSTLFVAPAVG